MKNARDEISKDVADALADVASRADFGDPRRSKRAGLVMSRLSRAASFSLPRALGSEAELEAAYRFMNNDEVTFEAALAPHIEATAEKARQVREVLAIHDTTECSFPNLDPEELGYLQTGKAGFRLHETLALDTETWRRPLGILHAEALHRQKRRRSRKKNRSGGETAGCEEREFTRWWRGIKATSELLAGCERVVHIADRESDSFELMWQTLGTKQDFVFRVRVDRRSRNADDEGTHWSTVKQVASSCAGVLQREVAISGRKKKSAPQMNKTNPPRSGRMATLSFAATRVRIPRPQYLREPIPSELELNLVHVVEVDAPLGEPKVEWLLYTTLPIETQAQIEDIVDKYRARWAIEEYNAALKTGCAYEEREFESRHALLVMLAMSMPIAAELLALRSRARTEPDAPAAEVFTPIQIRVLRAASNQKLSERPTCQEALLAVARLGGHLKRNGPPGWKVLYRGMETLKSYEVGWTLADAAAHRKRPDL
jgi:hypothetical protein